MASYEDHKALRGLKRPLDDEDDMFDLDSLDPRNHPSVPQPSFGQSDTNPDSSDIAGKTEDLNSSAVSSSSSNQDHESEMVDSANEDTEEPPSLTGLERFADILVNKHEREIDRSDNTGQQSDFQLPTKTASILTPSQIKDPVDSSSGDEDLEKHPVNKKSVKIQIHSSSPNKSPKNQIQEQNEKDKRILDEKVEDDGDAGQKSKREKQEEERLRMQVLVSNFSEDQLNRYEMFRRAAFPKAAIKRLMQNITGTTISHNIVIAMSGISKVFVGEVVETALDVTERWGESGPIQPKHLREAVRLLKHRNSIPNTKYKSKLFR